jgi:hypothetical protein
LIQIIAMQAKNDEITISEIDNNRTFKVTTVQPSPKTTEPPKTLDSPYSSAQNKAQTSASVVVEEDKSSNSISHQIDEILSKPANFDLTQRVSTQSTFSAIAKLDIHEPPAYSSSSNKQPNETNSPTVSTTRSGGNDDAANDERRSSMTSLTLFDPTVLIAEAKRGLKALAPKCDNKREPSISTMEVWSMVGADEMGGGGWGSVAPKRSLSDTDADAYVKCWGGSKTKEEDVVDKTVVVGEESNVVGGKKRVSIVEASGGGECVQARSTQELLNKSADEKQG